MRFVIASAAFFGLFFASVETSHAGLLRYTFSGTLNSSTYTDNGDPFLGVGPGKEFTGRLSFVTFAPLVSSDAEHATYNWTIGDFTVFIDSNSFPSKNSTFTLEKTALSSSFSIQTPLLSVDLVGGPNFVTSLVGLSYGTLNTPLLLPSTFTYAAVGNRPFQIVGTITQLKTNPTPEPAAIVLLGLGLPALLAFRRKRSKIVAA